MRKFFEFGAKITSSLALSPNLDVWQSQNWKLESFDIKIGQFLAKIGNIWIPFPPFPLHSRGLKLRHKGKFCEKNQILMCRFLIFFVNFEKIASLKFLYWDFIADLGLQFLFEPYRVKGKGKKWYFSFIPQFGPFSQNTSLNSSHTQ